MECFKFGVDISPEWFLNKVESGLIEYVRENGTIVGCKFLGIKNNTATRMIGQVVAIEMFCDTEPSNKEEEGYENQLVSKSKEQNVLAGNDSSNTNSNSGSGSGVWI